jgi:glycosyltransferase involved in cell wall biosynthesis
VSGIHQFVPMLHRGDAVGRHTLRLRDLMVARGIPSRVYVELIDPETEAETEPAPTYAVHSEPGDVLLYQFATASDLAPWLAARPETLVVNYHNITPPELFAAWDNRLALHQLRAQHELRLVAPRTALGVAVSDYNRRDLDAAGFGTTVTVPPAAVLPPAGLGEERDLASRGQRSWREGAGARAGAGAGAGARGGAHWLCVGRMAPNKAIEHVLMGLLVARSSGDPAATLEIVGKPVIASYTHALHRFVAELGLQDAVIFRGHASDDDLAAAYERADVLVVASEHEGFGVPVIEAMSIGLPVVASSAGALPEIVGDAGTLIDTEDPWVLASTIAAVLGDPPRRQALALAGRTRLNTLHLERAGDRLIDLVCGLT